MNPLCLDALSSEELRYIVGNDRYKNILSDLLTPFVDDELREESLRDVGSGSSADHTVADDRSEQGTDNTPSIRVHKLDSCKDRVDTSSSADGKAPRRAYPHSNRDDQNRRTQGGPYPSQLNGKRRECLTHLVHHLREHEVPWR